MTFKAYMASYDNEDWMTFVHGETRGKAKYQFYKVDPSGDHYWNGIRLTRFPAYDDRPFIYGEEYDQLFRPDGWDHNGDPVWTSILVDCRCPLCVGAK